jgi:quercetin dioxygenase-like cupin family protein
MAEWVMMAPGVRRLTLVDGDKLMLIQAELEKGAVVAEHNHPHEQATYVVSGRVEFTVSGKMSVLKPGQSIHMPSNAPHSVVAVEATVLLDAFSPPREDFRSK